MSPLHLFYAEPDPDRWLPGDRHPRRLIRCLVRGKPQPGGHQRVFLNLCAGLDQLGVAYRVNDYRSLRQHPEAIACIIGKPHLLDAHAWKNPILFGAAGYSHPLDDPDLLKRLPVRGVLVPGEWMRQMFEPYYGDRVFSWPVGIDSDRWLPGEEKDKDIDVLVYDKVRWERDRYERELITPIQRHLAKRNLRVMTLCYGFYKEAEFQTLLERSKAMIFLCEHETQGIAYQQALSCNVPILAWERGGYWRDPNYFPKKVQFFGVSSVPYWSDRCGLKFTNLSEFQNIFNAFFSYVNHHKFSPRQYILENLTLKQCAQSYLNIVNRL